MVVLDIQNSRMKDFYDIWFLAAYRSDQLSILTQAIQSTFLRRATPLKDFPPFALAESFLLDGAKQAQWAGFLRQPIVGSSEERVWDPTGQ